MGSDHFPLQIDLKIRGIPTKSNILTEGKIQENYNCMVNWKTMSNLFRNQYAWDVTVILTETLKPKVFECNEPDCEKEWHKRDFQDVCSFK